MGIFVRYIVVLLPPVIVRPGNLSAVTSKMSSVLPSGLRKRHAHHAQPVAFATNVALPPTSTVSFVGCFVMIGAPAVGAGVFVGVGVFVGTVVVPVVGAAVRAVVGVGVGVAATSTNNRTDHVYIQEAALSS